MDRILFRKKTGESVRLLVSLTLVLFLTAGWAGPVQAAARIQMMNSSGNWNGKPSVDPIRKSEGFSTVLYDNRNGLPTSEANAIAQTSEGFIWIGSYAGLIRYDGTNFERIDSTTGISNVRCLYVDSQDRLWIGTNDTGVFLMSKGELRKWGKKEGQKSVSIRAIAEDQAGLIYIGGTAGVTLIDADMNLSVLKDERIGEQIIRDLRLGNDGLIYGLTQNGDLFTLKDGKVLFFLSSEECRVKDVLAILPDPKNPGDLYLGTEQSQIYYGSLERNFSSMGMKDIGSLTYVERFEYINGHIWICAGNGIGRIDDEGYHSMKNVPMNSSVGHVMTDYEGNLWFSSTRQGIMKIVPNKFTDLFERYDLPAQVVNTTCLYGRQLFIGTDNGLIVIEDEKKLDVLPLTKAVTASGTDLETEDLLAFLDGVRIRSIIRDSEGRLWICTWRKYGLIRYDRGEVLSFTSKDGLFSDQVRTVIELEDGSILAANRGGASIIQGDCVTGGCGEQDGIAVSEILTVAEGVNHELLLGSDGGGIYIVSPEGTKHVGTEEGLNSDVILRIRRSLNRDIFWIVTSNSLAYMTPDGQVTTIQQFPYPNNFDLYENSKGDVWILSSSGVYVISAEELLANGTVEPVFYGVFSGLPYVPVANSFSELAADGSLYIASSLGVVKVNIEKPFENISDLKIALPYLDADGRRYYPNDSGEYDLPGNVRKLTVYPYVFNYSLINPQVSYRLEGFDPEYATVSRNELVPVDYTNLRNAAYQFVVSVKDPVGHTDKTVSFRIVKGGEESVGAAGSIIMDLSSLFFMGGLLIYTSLYRKRGRLDDKLFLSMILVNMTLAVSELIFYLLEDGSVALTRELMYAGNTVFYAALEVFPYLFLLYLDYRAWQDKERIRKMKLLYGIPCLLFFILLAVNLKTGWIFSITAENVYQSGSVSQIVFIPLIFYFLISLTRVHKINPRLVLLGILLIFVRILLDLWYPGISSVTFIYTVFLICVHIHVINQPTMIEEAL